MSTLTNPHAAIDIMIGLGDHLKVDLSLSKALRTAMLSETSAHGSGPVPVVGNVLSSHLSTDDQSFLCQSSNQAPGGSHSDVIHDALADLRNWKLDNRFFAQFPEFREPYRQSQVVVRGLTQSDINHNTYTWTQA